uniref:Fe2OG dioxygenase domain-containing protein n=1 Tax=Arcella intermedia TaxID=1963864 RepID=A0A6B2LBK8_9EUKA
MKEYVEGRDPGARAVQEIAEACRRVGFFVVVDHGVPLELCDALWKECFAFWGRPPQSFIAGAVTQSPFVWLDFCPSPNTPVSPTDAKLHKDNWLLGPTEGRKGTQWRPDTPNMEKLWFQYYNHMENLLTILMELFAMALDQPKHFFTQKLTTHNHPLRSVYYPGTCSTAERAGEHTDWGCVTILMPDPHTSGLQIKNCDLSWTDVPLVPNSFVVNLGDLFPLWTGGKWRATAHRVIAENKPNQAPRMSIPFFGLVDEDTVIEVIGQESGAQQDGIKKGLTAGEFFADHEKYSIYK